MVKLVARISLNLAGGIKKFNEFDGFNTFETDVEPRLDSVNQGIKRLRAQVGELFRKYEDSLQQYPYAEYSLVFDGEYREFLLFDAGTVVNYRKYPNVDNGSEDCIMELLSGTEELNEKTGIYIESVTNGEFSFYRIFNDGFEDTIFSVRGRGIEMMLHPACIAS